MTEGKKWLFKTISRRALMPNHLPLQWGFMF